MLGLCFYSLLGTNLKRQEELELRSLASHFLRAILTKTFASEQLLPFLLKGWIRIDTVSSFFHCFSMVGSVFGVTVDLGMLIHSLLCVIRPLSLGGEVQLGNAWQTHCFTPGVTSQSPSGLQCISNSNKLLSANSDPPLIEFVPTGLKAGLVPLITQTPVSCRDLLSLH